MQEITVKAPAKLNLALDIVGTDGRGYHLMKMVMQTIGPVSYTHLDCGGNRNEL